ncbi:WD40/YVTN/BNR-like repeat-containing protein [Myxococcota bacterium]
MQQSGQRVGNTLAVIVLFACVLATGTDAHAQFHWTRSTIGGGGGQLALAVDPTNDEVAYLSGDLGGIYKTIDRGGSWFSIQNNLPNSEVASIRIDPLDSQIVYVTTLLKSQSATAESNGEIYRSRDGGQTWEVVYAQPPGSGNIAFYISYKVSTPKNLLLPFDPSNPTEYDTNGNGVTDVIIVGGWAGRDDDTNPHGSSGVWKSTDEGRTFNSMALPNRNIYFVLSDPNSPQTVFAGTAGDGVYKSTDLGETWSKLAFPSETSHLGTMRISDMGFSVSARGGASEVIYLSVDESPQGNAHTGIYKSADGGATWSHVFRPDDPAIYSWDEMRGGRKLLVDHQDPSGATVAIGVKAGYSLYMSTDGGAQWTRQTQQTNPSPPAPDWESNPWFSSIYAFDQGTNGTMYAGLGRGAIVYDAAEQKWVRRSRGIGNVVVTDVELDPSNPLTAYLTIMDSGAPFKTTDGGVTWAYGDAIEVCMGTDRRLDKMADIAISGSDPTLLYAIGYAKYKDDTTVVKSTDAGGHWAAVCTGLPESGPTNSFAFKSVEINPVDNDIVLLTTHQTKIYRTTNGGAGWEFIRDIPSSGTKIEFTDDGQSVVVGGHTNVYVSDDAGLSWTDTTPWPGLAVFAVDVCPSNGSKIVAGINLQGAVLSDDRGATWRSIFDTDDLMALAAGHDLVLSDHARTLYVSTIGAVRFDSRDCNTIYLGHDPNPPYRGLGLARTTDSGDHWELVSTGAIFGTIAEMDVSSDGSRIVVGGLEMGFGVETPAAADGGLGGDPAPGDSATWGDSVMTGDPARTTDSVAPSAEISGGCTCRATSGNARPVSILVIAGAVCVQLRGRRHRKSQTCGGE